MRSIVCILFLVSCFLLPAHAELPQLSFPATMEVVGNGLHAVAFVVDLGAISAEAERGLRYSFKGLPKKNPPVFDESSKLFFWRPEPGQAGPHKFTLLVKDPAGRSVSRSLDLRVLPAPSLEALPRGWEDMKKEDRYLIGRRYYPSSGIFEAEIAARPDYQIEIIAKNSYNQECLLRYLPEEGQARVNKSQLTAEIMLGGEYRNGELQIVRRDLYEDFYHYFGMIFNRIESVKVKGGYALEKFRMYDRPSLISAFGADEIYLPVIDLSFDDRVYQEGVFSAQDPMMIADAPVIKVEFQTPSGLIWRSCRLMIDETEYHAARNGLTRVVVKPYKDISTFDVKEVICFLTIPLEKKLPFGEHHVVFEAQNAFGQPVSREAFVRVVSVPAQVQGKPVVFPSPFDPQRDRELKIQYRLSMAANMEIAIFGMDGSAVMKKRFFAGEEGGRKGLNTVTWDGSAAGGYSVPNGVYTGVIIDKDENRILEKFKLTVYR